jgi:hypothetical protein
MSPLLHLNYPIICTECFCLLLSPDVYSWHLVYRAKSELRLQIYSLTIFMSCLLGLMLIFFPRFVSV